MRKLLALTATASLLAMAGCSSMGPIPAASNGATSADIIPGLRPVPPTATVGSGNTGGAASASTIPGVGPVSGPGVSEGSRRTSGGGG